MGMKIVASAGQPFAAGSRVKFSVVGVDDATGQGSKEDRNCFWQATRLSGPPQAPVGFSVPQCVAMTDVVEFPVEPGVWILMAKNKGGRTVSFRYHVDALPVETKTAVPFSDMDPEFVLQRMRKVVDGLEKLKSRTSCVPEPIDHTLVAAKPGAVARHYSEAARKMSADNLNRLLAKSRGTQRYALRAILSSNKANDLAGNKVRTLHVFASRINGVWSLTDWTSLGGQGSETVYAQPRSFLDVGRHEETNADILADLEGALNVWRSKWPYQEGFLSLQGQVEGLTFSGICEVEAPGKEAEKWAGFLDGVSMITMAAGFMVPPLFVVSMIAGGGAAAIRVNESSKQGKGIEDNFLDVLMLVSTATTLGRIASGTVAGMSRVASVVHSVEGKGATTFLTWADDLANGACFVMMTPEAFNATEGVLSNESLTPSEKFEQLVAALMPMGLLSGMFIHHATGKTKADFPPHVLDPKAEIRPTELLSQRGHTNERNHKTVMGKGKRKGEGYERLDEPESKKTPPSEGKKAPENKPPEPELPLNQYAVDNTLNYMHPEDTPYKNIMRRDTSDVNPGGVFDFVGHGSELSVGIDNLVKKPGAPKGATGKEWFERGSVSPENFAKHLLSGRTSYKKGQEIRLLSCSTGKNPEGFAQKLADILNVKVHAPTDTLWVGPDGKYVVSEEIVISVDPKTGKRKTKPKIPPTGEFKEFAPREANNKSSEEG